MATTPTATSCTGGAWTKVATATTCVSLGFDVVTPTPLYVTQVPTGASAPSGLATAHVVPQPSAGGVWPVTTITTGSPVDVYVYAGATTSVIVELGVSYGLATAPAATGANEWYVVDAITISAVANASPDYQYLSMAGVRGIAIQLEKSGGADTWDLDIEASVEGYTSAEDWLDCTAAWTFVAGSATADCIAVPTLPGFVPAAFRTEITTAGGGNANTYNLFVRRWY